jgi:hypothetical protein
MMLKDCPLCYQVDAFLFNKWHALTCPKLLPTLGKKRHDRVGKIVARYVTRADGDVEREPVHLGVDNKRLDHLIDLGADQYHTDVTVVHPAAPSYADHSLTPLACARKAANAKLNKYIALAAEHNARFVPIAMETFGGMVESAHELFAAVAAYAAFRHTSWSPKEIATGLRAEIAISVQSGNHEMVCRALRVSPN